MHKFLSEALIYTEHQMREYSEEQIKKEPMLFSCDFDFAMAYGGPITREFLTILFFKERAWKRKDFVFDSRSHMLMPGFWPCIPGWHHDDVPRDRSDGQPDYYSPQYKAKHCMALVNGDVAPTDFALGYGEFQEIPVGQKYYKEWHPHVERMIKDKTLYHFKAPSNKLIYFDWNTWHKGSKAVKAGWRWFGRASINTNRPIKNEIRTQVQVYVDLEEQGW